MAVLEKTRLAETGTIKENINNVFWKAKESNEPKCMGSFLYLKTR